MILLIALLRVVKRQIAHHTIIISAYFLALIISLQFINFGIWFPSLTTIVLATWLMQHDIARKTIKQKGFPRYIAICLLSGYIWLGISGFLSLIFGIEPAGLKYNAVLYSVFLGFVFSMIFGHALIMRISGDITIVPILRRWGGLLNKVAVYTFFVTMAVMVQRLEVSRKEAVLY